MNKTLTFSIAASLSFAMAPAISWSQNTSNEANIYWNKGLAVMKEADKYQGIGYDPKLLPQALYFFKKAYEINPTDLSNLDYYAVVLFHNGDTLKKPSLMLSSCTLLRESASKGGEVSKEVLEKNWKDCAKYGNRLYLADDNVIRISGTARSGGGLSIGDWGAR